MYEHENDGPVVTFHVITSWWESEDIPFLVGYLAYPFIVWDEVFAPAGIETYFDNDADGVWDPYSPPPYGIKDATLVIRGDGTQVAGSYGFTVWGRMLPAYVVNGGEQGHGILTIEPSGHQPVADDKTVEIDEDCWVGFNLTGHDDDAEDTLTYHIISSPQHGSLSGTAPTVLYMPDPDFFGTDSFTFNISDNHNDYSNTATVNIIVQAIDDEPVAADDSTIMTEDSGVQTIDVLVNDRDVDGDTLSVTSVDQGAHGSVLNNGTNVSYQPDLDFFGTDFFSYTISDGHGGTSTAFVDITVTPVNDAPSFWSGHNQSVNEDCDIQVITGWASEISAGPKNEADQTVKFLVNNDSPWLFKAQPSIAPDGTLTYMPFRDLFGTAIVTAQLEDSGGTDYGGTNLSAAISFLITINPINDRPVVSNNLATQNIQYSDSIAAVTVSAVDIDSFASQMTAAVEYRKDAGILTPGLPNGLTLSAKNPVQEGGPAFPLGDPGIAEWTITGDADVMPGTYIVRVTIDDGSGSVNAKGYTEFTIVVFKEDASMLFQSADPAHNPSDVKVDRTRTGSFTLEVHITQANDGNPGNIDLIGLGSLSIQLDPAGPGSPVIHPADSISTNAIGERVAIFDLTGVPVNAYFATVKLADAYYTAANVMETVTVYDPNSGAAGGGWFYWPDTQDKTHFSFIMQYGRNGTNVKGSFALVRHTADGMISIRSNVLETPLLIGQYASGTTAFGWASFLGKCTFTDVNGVVTGNVNFSAYAEDWADPGRDSDKIWINITGLMPMPSPGKDHAILINAGNISIPHTTAKTK